MFENIEKLIKQPEVDWKALYPDWDNSAMNCGPNKYIAGDAGDDFDAWNNLQIYYNREAERYYLDQAFYAEDLIQLENQLTKLLENLHKYNEKEQA